MKKYLTLFTAGIILILSSCASKDDIDNLQSQIDGLKFGQIATIEAQINSIDGGLSALEYVDREIKGFITGLQNTAEGLQKSINTADGKIDDLEKALNVVNTAIANLQKNDNILEQMILDLKDYVDTQLKNTKDWTSATFATLDQYNRLVSEIEGIKSSITSITTELSGIEPAYTKAISKAVSSLENSLKGWVNEQLEGYWTIAETEGKLETLEGNLAKEDESIRGDIGKLRASLDSARTELTEGYKAAIKSAIETNNGVLDGKLSEAVSNLNTRIDGEVSTINERIGKLEKRVLDLESAVSELLSQIQSLAYIPRYTDGASTMWFHIQPDSSIAAMDTLEFRVSPADCVDDLVNVWERAVSTEAVSLLSRSSQKTVSLPVTSVVGGNGKISVLVDGSSLCEEFFNGELQMSIVVIISDGNNERTSEYISIVPKEKTVPDLYVDLGLSVFWATCNVGASYPDENGDYYAWGELETKSDYSWSTYKWCNGDSNKLTRYCHTARTKYWDGPGAPDGRTELKDYEYADDVVRAKFEDNWRTPTMQDWIELIDQCYWTWTNLNGTSGYLVKSTNGKCIFLPAAGCMIETDNYWTGIYGYYWSSSLSDPPQYTSGLDFGNDYISPITSFKRSDGLPIRPVMSK